MTAEDKTVQYVAPVPPRYTVSDFDGLVYVVTDLRTGKVMDTEYGEGLASFIEDWCNFLYVTESFAQSLPVDIAERFPVTKTLVRDNIQYSEEALTWVETFSEDRLLVRHLVTDSYDALTWAIWFPDDRDLMRPFIEPYQAAGWAENVCPEDRDYMLGLVLAWEPKGVNQEKTKRDQIARLTPSG